MLMLQALKCRTINLSIYEKYNQFSDKKHHLIVNYDNVLKTRYMRERGIADGQKAYQEFSTKVANSHAALRQSPGSCDMADGLLTLAINASDTDLPTLARSFSESPAGVGEECITVAPATMAEAPMAAPDKPPATAMVAAAAPQAPAAAAPPPPAPPAPAPSPAAALEAAAIALQSAAASLKAQSAPATPKPAAATTTGEATPIT
ncbi:hypothetical protein DM806_18650 [Sphingobium lactosutens]|nr:hypothetical protein [Sphingobium lactosutens]